MSLVVGTNSYFDLAEANEIATDIFFEESDELNCWTSLNDKNKEVLIKNTTSLFEQLLYIGNECIENSMRFPRIINNNKVEFPDELKEAVIDQCIFYYIMRNTDEYKMKKLGIKSFSIEGASTSFTLDNASIMENGISKEVYHKYIEKWVY